MYYNVSYIPLALHFTTGNIVQILIISPMDLDTVEICIVLAKELLPFI
jgi:hypothetical protein